MFNLANAVNQINTNSISVLDLHDATVNDYEISPEKTVLDFTPAVLCFDVYKEHNFWNGIIKLTDSIIVCVSVNLILICDIVEGKVLHRINNESYVDRLLCINESTFVTADRNQDLKVWDAYTGKIIKKVVKLDPVIKDMKLFSDNCVAIFSFDTHIILWHVETGTFMPSLFQKFSQPLLALHVHNNQYLITSHAGGSVNVWNLEAGYYTNKYKLPQNVNILTFDLQNDVIASHTTNPVIYRLSPQNPTCPYSLKPFHSDLYSLTLLPTGCILACGGGEAAIFDKKFYNISQFINLRSKYMFLASAVLSDGRIVIQNVHGKVTILSFPRRNMSWDDVKYLLEPVRGNKSITTLILPDLNLTEIDEGDYRYQISMLFESKPKLELIMANQMIHHKNFPSL